MVVFKSILAGLAFDIAASLALLIIFLVLVRRSGMFGIGPLRIVVTWLTLYLLAAFACGFFWMYRKQR